ncbi:hypothetical protein LSAT2_012013 [Lamellibrachia satsuma]|nr:hypothetical protein LSAT2_012013 [Lamellibrachia satsuma]
MASLTLANGRLLLIVSLAVGHCAVLREKRVAHKTEHNNGNGRPSLSPCLAAQQAAAGLADAFVPSCSSTGEFERKQCYMFPRSCWCVDPRTGVEIKRTRQQFYDMVDCNKQHNNGNGRPSLSPCLAAQQAAAGWADAFVPSCSSTGEFERKQCYMFPRSCWCVDPRTGVEIKGTRQQFYDMVDCNKEHNNGNGRPSLSPCLAAQQAAAGWADAFVPSCSSTGEFERKQCYMFPRSCWCVDPRTGVEIKGTRQQFYDMVDCNKEHNNGNGRPSLSPCLAAQQAAAGWADAFVPSCSSTGEFERKQCYMFPLSCWCVDPKTGVEIQGTRRQYHEGLVNCKKQ